MLLLRWTGLRGGDAVSLDGDSPHVRIPPAAHTYQSDVETVHPLEKDEFFDLEDFTSRGEFAKVHTYQLYFNLARPNSHKENQSPWQIIERLAPRSPLHSACFHPSFWIITSTTQGDTMYQGIPMMSALAAKSGFLPQTCHSFFVDVGVGQANIFTTVAMGRNNRFGVFGTSMNPYCL